MDDRMPSSATAPSTTRKRTRRAAPAVLVLSLGSPEIRRALEAFRLDDALGPCCESCQTRRKSMAERLAEALLKHAIKGNGNAQLIASAPV